MKKAGRFLESLLEGVQTEEARRVQALVEAWKEVSGDHGAHSRLVDVRFNAAVIEVDHPARIQLLRLHEEGLVSRLRSVSGVYTVRRLTFRLASLVPRGKPAVGRKMEPPGKEELAHLRALVRRLQERRDAD